MHRMFIPMDYHVWGAMLERYQRHTPKLPTSYQAEQEGLAPRPQCAVNWDRNLKPKLAIMLQCIPSQTDGQTDGH